MSRRWAVAVLGAGLALAAAGAGAGSFLVADQERPAFRDRLAEERARRRALLAGRDDPDIPDVILRIAGWIEIVLQVLVVVAVLAALGIGLYVLVRRLVQLHRLREERSRGLIRPARWSPGESSDEDVTEELRRRVSRELDVLAADLDTAPDPREAVIACYARMEALAAAAGTPRHPHETPAELLTRLLAEQQVPEPAVRRLTALFEEARFSRHPVDEEMRATARASLADVRAALGVPA